MGCGTSFATDDNLYIIAPIFNPVGFNSRVRLYEEFASRLRNVPNVILYTIECVFGSQPFSVTNHYNPHHIQIRTTDDNIWWVKENLINMCVIFLPASSQYIAWIDADIEYPKDNSWVTETIWKFNHGYKVLQLFSEVDLLDPSGEILERNKSFGYHIAHDDWSSYAHPGMAWAMRKDAFIKLGGLYDMNPIGSSDLHFAHALIGNVKQTIKETLSIGYKNSVCEWASRLSQIVGISKREYMKTVGYVDVRIKHHYHGNKNDRQYVDRWNILESNRFDPDTFYFPSTLVSGYIHPELRRINESVSRQFKEALVQYFRNRNEDNMVVRHDVQSNSDPRIVYIRPSQPPVAVWTPIVQPRTDTRSIPMAIGGTEQYKSRHEDSRIVYSKPPQPRTDTRSIPRAAKKPEQKNYNTPISSRPTYVMPSDTTLETMLYIGAIQPIQRSDSPPHHTPHCSPHHTPHCLPHHTPHHYPSHHDSGFAHSHPSY
jgi:hypothetical protein